MTFALPYYLHAGFSDFFSEFFHALGESGFPKSLRMVVLGNKPNFQFTAFQVSHLRGLCATRISCLHLLQKPSRKRNTISFSLLQLLQSRCDHVLMC